MKKEDLDTLFANNQVDVNMSVFPVIEETNPLDDFTLQNDVEINTLPLLPLRNMVLLPGLIMPVLVGREKSKRLIRHLEKTNGFFGAVTQKETEVEDPNKEDLYPIGVVGEVFKIMEMPNNTLTVIIRGRQRFQLNYVTKEEPFLEGHITLLNEIAPKRSNPEFKVLLSSIKDNLAEILHYSAGNIPEALQKMLLNSNNPRYIIHTAITHLNISTEQKQGLLELDSVQERGMRVLNAQQEELEMLQLKESLLNKTRSEMDKQQKDYFLQQQIRTLQEELNGSGEESEINEIRREAKKTNWSKDIAKSFEKEIHKAERLNPHSPDYAIQMQYLRFALSLPWGKYTKDNNDLKRAKRVLDKEHYGLDKVKERILEHLAVLKLKGDMKAPIICLYGPPGVGKTSLGKSIAESLGRKYERISLGGVHDEAEIRGHRRTYIGAMSGRIIKALQSAGSSNPVFVLDEIDKISNDFKGDPSDALLEVLDPEQNTHFHDNYLDLDFDLSKVLFIATANNIGTISQPLRDRMELIEVSGYIQEEKVQIAKKHLIPKAIKNHGLEKLGIKFPQKTIQKLIESYTRESGVRGLNKKISGVMRKLAWQEAAEEEVRTEVQVKDLEEYLGKTIYSRDKYQGNEIAGVVVGLAWTSVGGEILFIESSLHKGQDLKLGLTGNLGKVMKESASLALAYIKAHQKDLGIEDEVIKENSVHIHVPEGAVPKDGPSAGITMVTSLVSAMTGRKVKAHLAMTGEISLRGKVLPVGGIKEKILAAKRSGIKEIILCKENEKDILEINDIYIKGLTFHYVDTIDEVLAIALL